MYTFLLYIVLPFFVVIALSRKKLRKNLFERFFPPSGFRENKKALWIHAASVGEAVIAQALIDCLRQKGLSGPFVVTTNTFYTKDLLQKKDREISVYSMPFDLPFSLRRFLKEGIPGILIIVETELWPNMVKEARRRGIPTVIVNGRISDSSFPGYRRFSFFFRRILDNVDLVLAQSQEAARRFISIGAKEDRVITTGNIKYYRTLPETAENKSRDNVITFGSIREKEVDDIADTIQEIGRRFPSIHVYVAPRHLETVSALEKSFTARSVRSLRLTTARSQGVVEESVIIVDTMGELMDFYGASSLAFVGGSLAPYGGHNILEPLFFGTPVIFGPSMENFRDIADMVTESGAGITVQNSTELVDAISLLLADRNQLAQMARKGLEIVRTQNYQMERTAQEIIGLYRQSQRQARRH